MLLHRSFLKKGQKGGQRSRLSGSRWSSVAVGIIWAANVTGNCVDMYVWERMWEKERGLNLEIEEPALQCVPFIIFW